MTVWDPIRVKGVPEAQDEYDQYVGHVFTLLTQHKSDDLILDYLTKVVNDNMRLGPADKQEMLPTMQALRAIRLSESE